MRMPKPYTIVTGCERSGTTAIGKRIAENIGREYIHETWPKKKGNVVVKHSLNMEQDRKHLELMDFLLPVADWYFVIRDGREVCRSLVQKVWQRYPHTMSLDDAIVQWNRVNMACSQFGEVIRYEDQPEALNPKWPDYFTENQVEYMEKKLRLKQFGYEPRYD